MSYFREYNINEIKKRVYTDNPQVARSLKQNNDERERLNQPYTRKGFLNKTFDIIQRGNYASANMFLDAVDGGTFTPMRSAWKGFTGKEKTLFSNVLEELGVENKWVKAGLGFTLDVLLDPVTYLGIGAIGRGMKAARIGGQYLNKVGYKKLLTLTDRFGNKVGRRTMTTLVEKTGDKYVAKKIKRGITFGGKTIVRPESIEKIGNATGLTKVAQMLTNPKKNVEGFEAALGKVGSYFGNTFIPNFKPSHWPLWKWEKVKKLKRVKEYAVRVDQKDIILKAKRLAEDIPVLADREKIVDALYKSRGNVKELRKLLPDETQFRWAREISDDYKKIVDDRMLKGLNTTIREGYFATVNPDKLKKGLHPSHEAHKIFLNPVTARQEGAITDPLYAWSSRVMDHNRLKAGREFSEKMRETFGKTIVRDKQGVQQFIRGYSKAKNVDALSGWQFPREIVKDIEKIFQKSDEKAFQDFLRVYDRALGFWKGSVTSIFLPFHARNFMSNQFNMWLSGMKLQQFPGRLKDALDTQKYVQAVYKGKTEVINTLGKKKIGNMPMKDFVDWIRKTQVADEGWWGAEMGGINFYRKLKQKLTQKGVGKRALHPMTTGREMGLLIENNSKIALFADRIIKGDHPIEAAMKTKKYLFDYFQLTPTEKAIFKRAVPFYTWTRKNMPLQLEQLVRQPGKYAKLAKVREEIEAMSPDLNKNMKYMPDWMQRQYLIGLPSKKKDKLAFLSIDLAFQDLARGTTIDQHIASFSPFIKAPFEWAANYDSFRRRQLANPDLPPNELRWRKAKAIILNNLRIKGYLEKLLDADKALFDRTLNDIMGMNIYQYDVKRAKRFWFMNQKKYKRAIQREKSKMRKMGKTKYFFNTSQDYKTFWEDEFSKVE